jgi:hypothetical protein
MTSAPRLSRRDTAAALTAQGYPISPATLATLATRGGGPAYVLFNGHARYDLADAMAWAQSRVERPRACGAPDRQVA